VHLIIQSCPPKDEEITAVRKGLQAFNLKTLTHLEDVVHEFGFFLYCGTTVLGGITGRTFLGALQIKYLWIDENLQRKGYGQDLMDKAEAFGKSHGCKFSVTDTMSFQSLEFYQKNGYSIELAQEGYDGGEIAYHLRKSLL
jgi:ribosomal protein S18 acetylase RimI-like enzyme